MQTFLPYKNFRKAVKALDSKRLGKQRVEAYQILNILLRRTEGKGWRKHPAVLMWKGSANALKEYLNEAIKEWQRRGYKNNMAFEKIRGKVSYPSWLGNKDFHAAHRSNLLRKDWEHYSKIFKKDKKDLLYIWPKNK